MEICDIVPGTEKTHLNKHITIVLTSTALKSIAALISPHFASYAIIR